MILAIRTDKPTAELYLYQESSQIDSYKWEAHRSLADTLLTKIKELLDNNKIALNELQGIIVFTGEGSFTGLRIGTSTANALAYGLEIPVVAGLGKEWIKQGLENLKTANKGEYVIPNYSAEPNITKPKSD